MINTMRKEKEIKEKMARYLYYGDGLSLREVGKVFGVSGETVRKWVKLDKANQKKKSG